MFVWWNRPLIQPVLGSKNDEKPIKRFKESTGISLFAGDLKLKTEVPLTTMYILLWSAHISIEECPLKTCYYLGIVWGFCWYKGFVWENCSLGLHKSNPGFFLHPLYTFIIYLPLGNLGNHICPLCPKYSYKIPHYPTLYFEQGVPSGYNTSSESYVTLTLICWNSISVIKVLQNRIMCT